MAKRSKKISPGVAAAAATKAPEPEHRHDREPPPPILLPDPTVPAVPGVSTGMTDFLDRTSDRPSELAQVYGPQTYADVRDEIAELPPLIWPGTPADSDVEEDYFTEGLFTPQFTRTRVTVRGDMYCVFSMSSSASPNSSESSSLSEDYYGTGMNTELTRDIASLNRKHHAPTGKSSMEKKPAVLPAPLESQRITAAAATAGSAAYSARLAAAAADSGVGTDGDTESARAVVERIPRKAQGLLFAL